MMDGLGCGLISTTGGDTGASPHKGDAWCSMSKWRLFSARNSSMFITSDGSSSSIILGKDMGLFHNFGPIKMRIKFVCKYIHIFLFT